MHWPSVDFTNSIVFTRTLAVGPSSVGTWPITSTVTLTNTLGARHTVTDTIQIAQIDKCIPVTDTPVPTETSVATATPEPTSTRVPAPLFLPVLLNEEPCWLEQALDIALVLDTSSSMVEESPTKLRRATDAITTFVGTLKPTDRVALATFDSEGRLVHELTSNHRSLREALASVETGRTTRIDLGIQIGHQELISTRSRATARKVMVVLTDGHPNPVGPATVLTAATRAKSDGVTLFTISLGADVDHELLRSAATGPALYYEAPSAGDLERIYLSLLAHIPCDPARYWAGR